MQNICLRHVISDSVLFQFNMPDHYGLGYTRSVYPIRARSGVTFQEIVQEIESKTDDDVLETVTDIHHWFIVSLSVRGFKSIALDVMGKIDRDKGTNSTYREAMVRMAKELVASRDYDVGGGYTNKNHKYLDYWPKD